MSVNVNNRKVMRFRCTVDPMIPPKPRNAFDVRECAIDAELTPAGVYVKTHAKYSIKPGAEPMSSEFVIPYANIQNIQLFPEVAAAVDEKKKG